MSLHELGNDGPCQQALLNECADRREGNAYSIHFKEPAKRCARIAPAETIRSQSDVAPWHPGADEIGYGTHIIRGSDDRSLGKA